MAVPSASSSSTRPSSTSNTTSKNSRTNNTSSNKMPLNFPSIFAFLLCALFASSSLTTNAEAATLEQQQQIVRIRRDLPLSMDKEMFPPQDFDEEAPICLAEREPCGFYSFSLDGKAPLKWIKSWCRCSPKHECVYERTDMRMRVYRQTCVPKSNDTTEQVQQQQEQDGQQQEERHRQHHHHHRHRHARRANRRIIRRLRAILVD